PDGKYIAVAALSNQSVILWDADTGRQVEQLKLELLKQLPIPRAVAYKPRTGKLAVGGDRGGGQGGGWVGEPLKGKKDLLRGLTKSVQMVTWSPDGKLLAATTHGGGMGMVWDEFGKEVFPIAEGPDDSLQFSVAFSHDSTRLAVPHRSGKVKVW